MTVYKNTNYLNIGGRNFYEPLDSRVMLGNPAFMTNISNETKLHVSPFVVDFMEPPVFSTCKRTKVLPISQSHTSKRNVVRPGIDDEHAFPPFVSKIQYVYAIRCHRQTNKADSNFFFKSWSLRICFVRKVQTNTRDLNNYMIVLMECAFVGDGETSIHFAGPNDKKKLRSLYRYPRYYQYHNRIRVIGM